MQHIGIETCIRFKDISEDDDADPNQEYNDDELRPVFSEDSKDSKVNTESPSTNKIDDGITGPISIINDNEPHSKSDENKLDMEFIDPLFEKATIANDDTLKDQLLRKRISSTKGGSTTKGSSTSKGNVTTKDSTTKKHVIKKVGTVKSATTSTHPPKVAKQVPKENSSNVPKVLKKPTSELKSKKYTKLKHNDKQGINSTSRTIKRSDKKAADQKPGNNIIIFYYN